MDHSAAVAAGMALAPPGPPAIALLGHGRGLGPALAGQAAPCAPALVVLAVVLLWERRPLASIGLGVPVLHQPAPLGLALAAGAVLALGPVLLRLPGWIGLPDLEAGLAALARQPRRYLAAAVLVGGAVEEILHRGYAFSRLAEMTGSGWSAGPLVVVGFALAQLPLRGAGVAATTALSGAVLTFAFAWSGDLAATILAHVATDAAGILGGRRADHAARV